MPILNHQWKLFIIVNLHLHDPISGVSKVWIFIDKKENINKMQSYKFLTQINRLTTFEFFPFDDKIVDQTVNFLPIMFADIANIHDVDIGPNASHYGCYGEHQVYCKLRVVYYYLLRNHPSSFGFL